MPAGMGYDQLEPNRSLLDIISLKYEIEDLTGRTVDVVTAAGISPTWQNK